MSSKLTVISFFATLLTHLNLLVKNLTNLAINLLNITQ